MDFKKTTLLALLAMIVFLLVGCSNAENANESQDMGYVQEDTGSDEIPSELIGTWEASEGLPQGLITYTLTFGQDNQVTQVSQIEDGEETSETSKYIVDGNEVKILDPNNTVLMSLDFSDSTLTTLDLGNEKTEFTKKS